MLARVSTEERWCERPGRCNREENEVRSRSAWSGLLFSGSENLERDAEPMASACLASPCLAMLDGGVQNYQSSNEGPGLGMLRSLCPVRSSPVGSVGLVGWDASFLAPARRISDFSSALRDVSTASNLMTFHDFVGRSKIRRPAGLSVYIHTSSLPGMGHNHERMKRT